MVMAPGYYSSTYFRFNSLSHFTFCLNTVYKLNVLNNIYQRNGWYLIDNLCFFLILVLLWKNQFSHDLWNRKQSRGHPQKSILPGTPEGWKWKRPYIMRIDRQVTGYILPGFVDAHVHIEVHLVPSEFARMAVIHGTVLNCQWSTWNRQCL